MWQLAYVCVCGDGWVGGLGVCVCVCVCHKVFGWLVGWLVINDGHGHGHGHDDPFYHSIVSPPDSTTTTRRRRRRHGKKLCV